MKIYVRDGTTSSSFENKTLLLDPLCLLEINLGTTIIIMNVQVLFLLLLLEAPAANTSMRSAYYLACAVLWSEYIYTCPPVCKQTLFKVTNSRPLPFRF